MRPLKPKLQGGQQYYVRKTGNDSNNGTSPATAWLTVDKAANTVAAGDTVYIGAGVYRELVTMDTSGANGSVISFIGDVTGAYTGDPGLVIISAFDDDTAAPTRNYCVDMNAKSFIVWQRVIFDGNGSSTNQAPIYSNTGNPSFEGVQFLGCVFLSANTQSAVYLNINEGATPATAGALFRGCAIVGPLYFEVDENASAEVDLKIIVEYCHFYGWGSTGGGAGFAMIRTTSSTYKIGGAQVRNCFFMGCWAGVYVASLGSTTYPVAVRNCVFYNNANALYRNGGTAGTITSNHNSITRCTTAFFSVTAGSRDRQAGSMLLGGIADLPLRRALGWSPWTWLEPIRTPDGSYVNQLISNADWGHITATADVYGRPNIAGPRPLTFSYMDASDDAIADPNNAWTNEANIVNGTPTSTGSTSTAGSADSNFTSAGGVGVPDAAGGAPISQVRFRVYGNRTTTATGNVTVYTDGFGESLGSITIDWGTAAWSSWTALSVPAGGWDWTKVAALEFKAWKVGGTGSVVLGQVDIEVTSGPLADIGAVEAGAMPRQETTTVRTGSNAIRFEGAGWHEVMIPVDAALTSVSVYARKDANYSGDAPILEAMNIPGVADQSAAMAGGANLWEQLTVSFTPTSAGWCRVRLRSRDTSATGQCFFDDLTATP